MDKDQTTTPGTTHPTLYDKCVGSLTSPANQHKQSQSIMENTAFLFQAGGSQDQVLPPLDGMDVWNTISHGEPSPRKEILLNIDLEDTTASRTTKNGVSSIPEFLGIALRMGDMKLLMNVPNDTWYKPPELGGKSGKEQDIAQEVHGQLDWLGSTTKV